MFEWQNPPLALIKTVASLKFTAVSKSASTKPSNYEYDASFETCIIQSVIRPRNLLLFTTFLIDHLVSGA